MRFDGYADLERCDAGRPDDWMEEIARQVGQGRFKEPEQPHLVWSAMAVQGNEAAR